MNDKKLQEKLAKKTQQIIQGVVCDKCKAPVVYILCGHGTDRVFYKKCDVEQIAVTSQDGHGHVGYGDHFCEK
jgi:hypothetical protein